MYNKYIIQINNIIDCNIYNLNKKRELIDIGNDIYILHGINGIHNVLNILFDQNIYLNSRDYLTCISKLEILWDEQFKIFQD